MGHDQNWKFTQLFFSVVSAPMFNIHILSKKSLNSYSYNINFIITKVLLLNPFNDIIPHRV